MKIFLLVFLQLSLSTNLFAHGEKTLGPDGGYIRMPGMLHTELISNPDGSFKVYLLDINLKNPTTKDSSVELKYILNKKITSFNCKAFNDTYFLCKSNEITGEIKEGSVEIKAVRANKKSSLAKYSLPLTIR